MRSVTIDEAKNEIAFVCNHLNRMTQCELARLLLYRAEHGMTPVCPPGLTAMKFCYPHKTRRVRTVFADDKTLTSSQKAFGKLVVRAYLDTLERCVTWETFVSVRTFGQSIGNERFWPLPAADCSSVFHGVSVTHTGNTQHDAAFLPNVSQLDVPFFR